MAIVGSTSHSNPTVDGVLERGYLTHVKTWLDDILKGNVGAFLLSPPWFGWLPFRVATRLTPFSLFLSPGGVDLLLHLLKNIADLPVWTAVVKDSGLGKAIGSIEKHRICRDTPNEGPIREKVAIVKDHWKASVKARKIADPSSRDKVGAKREPVVSTEAASPSAKRTKVSESPKSSYFSSLVKKASGGDSQAAMSSPLAKAHQPTANATKSSTTSNPGKFRRVGCSAHVCWTSFAHYARLLSFSS